MIALSRMRCGIVLQGRGAWPYWAQWWRTWDWLGQIRPQIDAAKALGLDTIKVNGDGIADNGVAYPADIVFRARVQAICAYAATLGLRVYWQLGYRPNVTFGADRSNKAAGIASSAKVAAWLETIPNVIAIDLINEANLEQPAGWQDGNGAITALGLRDMRDMMTAIRAISSKPLTISIGLRSQAELTQSHMAAFAPLVDFHDYHVYPDRNVHPLVPADPDYAAPLRAAPWYRGAYVIGETGLNLGPFSEAERFRWMTSVAGQSRHPDCAGICHWGLFPTTGYPDALGAELQTGEWGAMRADGTLRPEMVAPLASWSL